MSGHHPRPGQQPHHTRHPAISAAAAAIIVIALGACSSTTTTPTTSTAATAGPSANAGTLLAAVQGERRWRGCVFAGERDFRGGSGCGGVARDDTVSVSDKGRPSPLPFAEVRGGP